jgi:hypothetical protein
MLQQNACLHTTAHTAENLHQLNSEMLKHPLYNYNLIPSNYYSKDALKGHHFPSDQDVKERSAYVACHSIKNYYVPLD